MNMQPCKANPLDVLKSINYVDNALFGLGIDIFKIRLLINACQSSELVQLGFEEDHGYICLDFRRIIFLDLTLRKGEFGQPYLEDDELAAIDLVDFNFEDIKIHKAGSTGRTDRLGEYREMRDIHEILINFTQGGSLQFQFVDLEASIFDPLDFDRRK